MSITIRTLDPSDNYEIVISSFPEDTAGILARWGWINGDGAMLVEAQIVVLQGSGTFPSAGNITADFRGSSTTPSFLYMAERESEPIKTIWYGAGMDLGPIGPGQTFSVLGTVAGWRIYRSSGKTAFSTTTEFRVS